MLSRRHLRIKALQSLYTYFVTPDKDLAVAEKRLFQNVEKIYDLYLLFLAILPELSDQARIYSFKEKNFPKKEDLQLARFYDCPLILQIRQNSYYMNAVKKHHIGWKSDEETVRKIFMDIKKSQLFKSYVLGTDFSFASQQKFLAALITNHICTAPSLLHLVEEKSIYWGESTHWMGGNVAKTIEALTEHAETDFLMPLFKDESDKEFFKELFLQTILHHEEFEKEIADKTKNWELERIALMDVIIMKMALAELIHFPFIPVKVTINEYLDIAKEFSTPGSHGFINGIIDNLANAFKATGKIKKTGAGLL